MSKLGQVVRTNNVCSFDEAVEIIGHGRYNYLLLITCCIISNAVALDMFGFSIVVAAATCDLRLGIKETGILASAPFAGVLFAFPWGYYADTRGRRRALLLSTSVGFAFAAASSLSPSWQIMLALKIIGTSFSTSSFTLTMTYLGEGVGSKHRSKYLFIMNSMNLASEIVSFGLAYFILSPGFLWQIPWLGMSFRSWRLYTFVISVPLGIGAVLVFCLYESPKFLANKGQEGLATVVLRKIYVSNGGKEDEFPIKQLQQYCHKRQRRYNLVIIRKADCPVVSSTVALEDFAVILSDYNLLFHVLYFYYTNNVFLMWFPKMVNLFFNSISGTAINVGFCEAVIQNITDDKFFNVELDNVCDDTITPETIYTGVILGLVFTIINLISSWFASWRRLVLISCFLISAISCTLVGLLTKPTASIVFFALIQTSAVGIGSVSSYFVDLYPTSYRGLVTSLGMMMARLTSFAGVNIIGVVIISHCNITFYSWTVFVLSTLVSLILLVEKKKIFS